MTELFMENIEIDESPSTIAYVLLVLMSALFDVSYTSHDSLMSEAHLSLSDENTGQEYARLYVSPVMADLLVAVLQDVGPMVQESIGSAQWRSMK